MAVSAAQALSVGTTAVLLSAAETDSQAGETVLVTNKGTVELVVGPAAVTATTGYRVAAGLSVSVDLPSGDALYGIVASGTTTADVLRTGV